MLAKVAVLLSRGFIGFQVMVGGTVFAALVHPWFYVLVGYEIAGGGFLARPASLLGLPFWAIAWFDLVAGYAAAMTLAAMTARRRGLGHLIKAVPLIPLYWLLISAAAYRAVWQSAIVPFKWGKTEHGPPATRPSRSARG